MKVAQPPREQSANLQAATRNPRLAWLRAALAGGPGEALWLFVTLRLAFSLFALLASALGRLPAPCAFPGGPATHTGGLDFRLLGVWQRWDACWYQRVATLGYRPNDPSVAFFPLYPLLMRAVSVPLAGDLTLAGLVVSGLAYIAAVTGLYRLLCLDFDEAVARRAALYLSVFPSAFFLFAPFTEALFLALAVWTLYEARRGAWGWAAPFALLVGTTRTQGVLLALPLAWEFVRRWRDPDRSRRPNPPAALVPLLPACGLGLFVAYGRIATGWTTFEALPRTWGFRYRLPWDALAASWRHIRARGDAIEALNLALLLLFGLLLLLGLRRLPLSYSLYVAPQLAIIATRQMSFSPLMSTSRYLLVLFPAFALLALWGRHRRFHYSWLLLSTLLLGFLLYAYLNGAFVA